MGNARELMSGVALESTSGHVCVTFAGPRLVLSSAVLNGGFVEATQIVNMKVCDHDDSAPVKSEPPEHSVASYSEGRWEGVTVGMMTAAPMETMRVESASVENEEFAAIVTAGLSNPRRAGDKSDVRGLHRESVTPGTINIIAVSSVRLSRAAMVESVMVIAEAKAAVLQELGVNSPVSGLTATGTGTDAVALACPTEGAEVRYAGKHVVVGETFASLVIKALKESIGTS